MIPHILTCMKFLFVVSCHCTNMIGCGKVYKLSTTKSTQDDYKPKEQLSFNCSSNIMVLLLEYSIVKGNISDRWNPIFLC